MAAFNCFLKEVTENGFTAEGGTAIAVLGRTALTTGAPSTTLKDKATGVGQKIKALLTLPKELNEALEAGEKVTKVQMNVYWKPSLANKKQLKLTIGALGSREEERASVEQGWAAFGITGPTVESLTKAELEALVLSVECIQGVPIAYEIYLEVTTEPGGVKGKASGTLLLTGKAKGTLASVLAGKATGTLLLTGTAAGTRTSLATGKATGTLLLTGTATGTRTALVAGKASGTLLLTGSATGTLQSVVSAAAAGRLLLTGRAKGHATSGGTRKVILLIFDE